MMNRGQIYQQSPFSQRNFSHSSLIRQLPQTPVGITGPPPFRGPLMMQQSYGGPNNQPPSVIKNGLKMKSNSNNAQSNGFPFPQSDKKNITVRSQEAVDVDPQLLIKFIKENQDLKTKIDEKMAESNAMRENIEQLQSLINDAAYFMQDAEK